MVGSGQLALSAAAVIHFAGVLVNLTAPWVYSYRKDLPKAEAIRQIFIGQAIWVTLLLAAMGALCLRFKPDLLGSSAIGSFLTYFLLSMWTARLLMQIAFFFSETRISHPIRYSVFLAAFVFQTGVFASTALGLLS